MDAVGGCSLYDESKTMTRIFIVDAQLDERKALRVVLQDLRVDIVGEAADYPMTLSLAPAINWNCSAMNTSARSAGSPEVDINKE